MISASYDADGSYESGEAYQVLLPVDWPARKGMKPPVLVHHGRGAGALQIIPGFGGRLFWELCERGYPVIAFAQGGTTTWGNDTAVARAEDAKDYILSLTGGSAVFHLGFSMGGAAACNYARTDVADTLGIALVVPAVDVDYIHDNNATYTDEIDTAYDDGWDDAKATHSPIEYAATDLAGVPIKVWYASNDTLAVTARQEAFITATGCEAVNLGAVTHTGIEAITPYDIPDFFDASL